MSNEWHVAGLSVGQVADRMDIARSAVRWYADEGLLPCERDAENHRRFFGDALCRVAMIRASQKVGLSLAEIRAALNTLPPRQVPSNEDWERLATTLREELNQRIDDLFSILDEFSPVSDTPGGSELFGSRAIIGPQSLNARPSGSD